MNRKLIEKAGDFIAKNCNADDFTFSVRVKNSLTARFARNAITQHSSGKSVNVWLEVAFGSQTGAACVNLLDDDSLKYLIETAEDIARFNQPDPEYVESESAHELPKTNNFAEETEKLSVGELVELVKTCVDNAKSKQAYLAGLAERYLVDYYLITKNGFEGFDRFSKFGLSMTMIKEEVETKVSKSVKNYKCLELDKEIARLNSQFDALRKPKKIDARKIPVILRPGAVFDLFQFLYWMMDLRDSDEGVTPFTEQLGQKFFGEKFSIRSTMDDAELSVPGFSNEGIPAKNISWVNKGVIENMDVSRYYAKVKGVAPAEPYNLLIEGEGASEAEMMNMVDQGLLINRLWYIRFVDQKRGELTGITRDGVLYFENGEIKHSVNNLRFNEVLHEVTRRILASGKSELQESDAKVPAMLIDDFNFVDATTF